MSRAPRLSDRCEQPLATDFSSGLISKNPKLFFATIKLMVSSQNARDRAVRSMFDRIAGRYDLLNAIISLRLDRWWRRKAIEIVVRYGDESILDLGTGTGDLAFTATRHLPMGRVIGLDFSSEMLRLACFKRSRTLNGDRALFVLGSVLLLPFRDRSFDAVVTAFVLRNVSDLQLFFTNSFRVLKPGGKLVSLDMFPPAKGIFSLLYSLYFYRLMPWIGGILAHDRSAYSYLAKSVRQFDPPESVVDLIQRAGFERVAMRRFLNGAVCMHIAEKASYDSDV
jgi:demethylmenaquinone methyltransferase/2-methoxy-6-polyprenyl-1,4-benzoquinol methylase